MLILFLCVNATTCVWRTICRNWFSPPTMLVLGVYSDHLPWQQAPLST